MLRESKMGKFVYWAPRILAIVFALILFKFALDAFFEEPSIIIPVVVSFWTKVGVLLVHLIPTSILVIVIWAAWENETAGGLMFAILGLIYLIMIWGGVSFLAGAVMTGPVFLTSALFFLNRRLKRSID